MITKNRVAAGFIILFAICLQIQTTITLNGQQTQLRLNLADLLIPFLGLLILFSLIIQKTDWPKWHLKHMPVWLSVLSFLIACAFLNGYLQTGELSRWALVNKSIGWAVLLCYLAASGWFIRNTSPPQIKLFLISTIGACLAFAYLEMGCLFIEHIFHYPDFTPVLRPVEGLADNKNAMAFLYIICLSILYVFHFSSEKLIPQPFIYLVSFITPFFLFYNGARILFLYFLIFIPLLLILKFKDSLKSIILPSSLSVGCIAFILSLNLPMSVFYVLPAKNFYSTIEYFTTERIEGPEGQIEEKRLLPEVNDQYIAKDAPFHGDANRLMILQKSFEHWKEQPIFGLGLGTVLHLEKQEFGSIISVIDSSPLWLLIEFGIVGLCVFLAFYVACLYSLWKNFRRQTGFYATLNQAVFFILLGFGVMSLFHELLYTRFLWVMMGLALAIPKSNERFG